MSIDFKNFSLPGDSPWLVECRESAATSDSQNRRSPPIDIPQKRDFVLRNSEIVEPKCKKVFSRIFFIMDGEKKITPRGDELMFPIEIENKAE